MKNKPCPYIVVQSGFYTVGIIIDYKYLLQEPLTDILWRVMEKLRRSPIELRGYRTWGNTNDEGEKQIWGEVTHRYSEAINSLSSLCLTPEIYNRLFIIDSRFHLLCIPSILSIQRLMHNEFKQIRGRDTGRCVIRIRDGKIKPPHYELCGFRTTKQQKVAKWIRLIFWMLVILGSVGCVFTGLDRCRGSKEPNIEEHCADTLPNTISIISEPKKISEDTLVQIAKEAEEQHEHKDGGNSKANKEITSSTINQSSKVGNLKPTNAPDVSSFKKKKNDDVENIKSKKEDKKDNKRHTQDIGVNSREKNNLDVNFEKGRKLYNDYIVNGNSNTREQAIQALQKADSRNPKVSEMLSILYKEKRQYNIFKSNN